MDYPSGNHKYAGTNPGSGPGSGSFAFAGCGVGGGGSFRPNPSMDAWDNSEYFLASTWSLLDSTLCDVAPDHSRAHPKHASPSLGVMSGGGAMIASANPDTASKWTSSGQHNPSVGAGHQRPTIYEDLSQGQVNTAFDPNTQWYQPFFDTAGPPRTASHQQAVNGPHDPTNSSGAFFSAPIYTPSLLASTLMPPVQPLQGGYVTRANSGFPSQPQLVNQLDGPSLSHESHSTTTPPDTLFNTTYDDREITHLPSVASRPTSPPAESYYALSPASAFSRDRRGSTAPTELTVPDVPPDPLPPSPLGKTKKVKVPSPTKFKFVVETPELDMGHDGSRKRAAEELPAGATSQTLSNVPLAGKNGEPQGAMITFGHRQKKRAAFTEEKKKQTKVVRKKGVCPRCKKAKKACDLFLKKSPYQPCDLCGSAGLYKGVSRMPCFQSTLDELEFFRPGPADTEPLHTNRLEIYELSEISRDDALIKNVRLTQGIGNHHLTVYASEFEPKAGEVLAYKWKDSHGRIHVMDMPRYSVAAIAKVRNHFKGYIETAKESYLKSVKDEDDLAWMTISVAMDYAKGRPESLVKIALDLWAVCRMIEIPWTICGDETLGIERVTDEQNPHHGKVPIPPTMDTQLDQVAIKHVLTPLRAKLIKKFEEVIKPPIPEAWFETYLTSFILLNHIEHLASHSVSHAKLHTLPSKYSNLPFLEGALHWAKIILSRFHFVCNGAAPLMMDWRNPEVGRMAKLNQEQVNFMVKTQTMVAYKASDIDAIRKGYKYENPLYWTSQLYGEDWDKSPAHVVEVR